MYYFSLKDVFFFIELIHVCFGRNGSGSKVSAGEQKGKQTHPSA